MPGPASTRLAVVVVLIAPGIAWLALVSWRAGAASDAQHVGWFLAVAAACLLAGTALPVRPSAIAVVAVTAWVAAVGTLFLWWSATDSSGLYVVGLVLAAVPMALAVPVLVMVGARLRRRLS